MHRLTALLVATIITGATFAQHPHDALALARAKAKHENQRVLLLLTGSGSAAEAGLLQALADYRALGKSLRYEYQLAALPSDSLAGSALRKTLRLDPKAIPALAILDTNDTPLASLHGDLSTSRVRAFLEKHAAPPVDAKRTLADALGVARLTGRKVFVYLSAPW